MMAQKILRQGGRPTNIHPEQRLILFSRAQLSSELKIELWSLQTFFTGHAMLNRSITN